LLQVQNKSGDTWLMKVEAPAEMITVRGTAQPNFLRKGMFVRFTAKLNEKGVIETPVEELFVFTPHQGFKLGIILESADEPADENAKKIRRRSKRGVTPGQYLVAGRLSAFNKDSIAVAAGKQVKAKLAENATIRIDVIGDYSLVKKGDSVEYRGMYYQKGQGIANYVAFDVKESVKAVEPQKTKSSAKRKKRSTSKPAS